MSSTTLANGCILLLLTIGCAGSSGRHAQILRRSPLSGPPQVILRTLPIITRGQAFPIEVALVGGKWRQDLRRPVAMVLTILDGRRATSVVTWGDPRVGRYFKWVVPAQVTAGIRYPYITVHIAVHHLSGYTLRGKPILTESFLWAAKRVKVQHPVANSGVRHRIHQTEVHD